MKRSILYVIVTDFPFGIGEPFFENELFELSSDFEFIYLVIPEIQLVDTSISRYKLPSNASLIELKTEVKLIHKMKAILELMKPSVFKEITYINGPYKLKLGIKHLKTILGFIASGLAFSELFRNTLLKHNHSPEKTSIYSYWFTFATWGLTYIKQAFPSYNIGTRIHGWDCFYYRNSTNYLPLRPSTIKSLDWICPISETGKAHLIEKIPDVQLDKIRVQYLGVDFRPSEFPIRYKKGILRIVSVSFIHYVKRIHLIIDALAKIDSIEVEWTHIGSWSSQTAWLQESAEKKLSQKTNIQYTFTGEKTLDEVRSFLEQHQADFILCTSESEGIPVSMMEALAAGIPIISTAVGGIPEIVVDQETGYLLPANPNADEIAKALCEIVLIDELQYSSLSKNAKNTYLKKFQAKVNYKKFAEEILND